MPLCRFATVVMALGLFSEGRSPSKPPRHWFARLHTPCLRSEMATCILRLPARAIGRVGARGDSGEGPLELGHHKLHRPLELGVPARDRELRRHLDLDIGR